jgi:hypothetical protein
VDDLLLNQFLLLAAVLFCIGVYGVLARRNAVLVLMSIELIMTAGLEHQSTPDPIEFLQKMPALFTHRIPNQLWSSLNYKSYRITAGMRINTMKCMH